MFIIFIKGQAKAFDTNGPVIDPNLLKQVNGVTYEQGSFTEYLADGSNPGSDDYGLSLKIKRDGGIDLLPKN